MPITPATMTPSRTKTPTTIKTIFRTVLPEVVGGGGTFGYGGLGGMGAPALIGTPRVFPSFCGTGRGYCKVAMKSIKKGGAMVQLAQRIPRGMSCIISG